MSVTSVMDSGEVQEAKFVRKIYYFFFPFYVSLFHLSKITSE